jgi:2'-5' RNA ligase
MHSVAVLLDAVHTEEVEQIWRELEDRFRVHGVQAVPYPHVSLLAFRGYDPQRLRDGLARVARHHPVVRVHAHGYGFFCGQTDQSLTLHVPLVRTEALSSLHHALRHELAGAGESADGFFEPDNWTPHITVADRDLTPDLLARIVRWLATRQHPSWTITMNNLTLIHDTGLTRDIRFQVRLPHAVAAS